MKVNVENFEIARAGVPLVSVEYSADIVATARVEINLFAEKLSEKAGICLPAAPVAVNNSGNRIIAGLLSESLIFDILTNADILGDSGKDELLSRPESSGILFATDVSSQGFVVCQVEEKSGAALLVVAANTAQGLFYGLETVVDRVCHDGNVVSVIGVGSNLFPVLNNPVFEKRSMAAFMSGPCYMSPGQWEKDFNGDYRAFVDWLANHKFNNFLDWSFTLDAGVGFKSERFADLVNYSHPNIKYDYLGEMIDYAASRYIDIWLFFKLPFRDYLMDKSTPHCPSMPVSVNAPAGHDYGIVNHVKTAAFDAERLEGQKLPFVCLSLQKTKDFWRDYIHELVTLYPKLGGIGCELGEQLISFCKCPACEGRQMELGFEYYQIMVETARKINPEIKLWFYRAHAAYNVMLRKNEFTDITMIDWGEPIDAWEAKRSVPRGDWFLYHTGAKEFAEGALKGATEILRQHNFEGIQIRGTRFKEWEHKFNAFKEFTWNPDLSLEDFARLNNIAEYGTEDAEAQKIYSLWMRLIRLKLTVNYYSKLSGRTPVEERRYQCLQDEYSCMQQECDKLLATSQIKDGIVGKIKHHLVASKINHDCLAGDFSEIYNCTELAEPWEKILMLNTGSWAKNTLFLLPGLYSVALVCRNYSSEPATLRISCNGSKMEDFVIPPGDHDAPSIETDWAVPNTELNVTKELQYKFTIELIDGVNCAFHRLRIKPIT